MAAGSIAHSRAPKFPNEDSARKKAGMLRFLQFPQRRHDGQPRGADGWKQSADQTNYRRPYDAAREQLRRALKRKRDLAEALEIHR